MTYLRNVLSLRLIEICIECMRPFVAEIVEDRLPHNLAYKTRFLRGGRPDRGAFEHSLIGRIVLWQSISYRRAIIHKIRTASMIIRMFLFISRSFYRLLPQISDISMKTDLPRA